jgi:hypothetical protein
VSQTRKQREHSVVKSIIEIGTGWPRKQQKVEILGYKR